MDISRTHTHPLKVLFGRVGCHTVRVICKRVSINIVLIDINIRIEVLSIGICLLLFVLFLFLLRRIAGDSIIYSHINSRILLTAFKTVNEI